MLYDSIGKETWEEEMPEYCLVKRDLCINANEEVMAVRNIWNVSLHPDSSSDQASITQRAKTLNEENENPSEDYVVCEGTFDVLRERFLNDRKP